MCNNYGPYSIPFYPKTLEGRRSTTDEFAISPFHLVLFSDTLTELAKPISVHILILSSYLFFCLPFFFFLSLCSIGLFLLNHKTLKRIQTFLISVLDEGQVFIIVCNGCLDLSVYLLIGNMVLVLKVQ